MRILALVLACTTAAAADEVVLKGGGRISGIAEEKDERVIIRTEHGTLTLPRDRVQHIDRTKRSLLQDYEDRRAKADLTQLEDVKELTVFAESKGLDYQARGLRELACQLKWQAIDRTRPAEIESFAGWAKANGHASWAERAVKALFELKRAAAKGADALYELGLWARAHGLAADALVAFQDAIKANPEHEFARRALGYHLHQGKWMTDREIKIAQGLLEFEGDWMTPAAKEAIIVSRTLEKERRLLEEARKRLDEERSAAREEYRKQKEALDARLAEVTSRIEELRRAPPPPPVQETIIIVHCPVRGCTLTAPHTHPNPFQK